MVNRRSDTDLDMVVKFGFEKLTIFSSEALARGV